MVKIRLMRMGAKKRPFFRVVVADSRSPRDGRFIENIGKYHPLADPSLIEIDEDRALHWLGTGAQPTQPVRVLMQKIGIWEKFKPEDTPRVRTPKGPKRSKKAAAAAGEAAEQSAEAAPAEAPAGETATETTAGQQEPAAGEGPASPDAPAEKPADEKPAEEKPAEEAASEEDQEKA